MNKKMKKILKLALEIIEAILKKGK